jgi:hypothetical protein
MRRSRAPASVLVERMRHVAGAAAWRPAYDRAGSVVRYPAYGHHLWQFGV